MKDAFFAFIAVAVAGPSTAQVPAQTIELRSFAYGPKVIRLAAGKPVTLTFINRSKDSHDFTAKSFFARARVTSGAAPGGEIDLKGGQSKSITLFPAAGRYAVHCSHFLHKQFGMRGEILVR